MKKGLFITFEGGEGSGKTTLLKRVQLDLENHSFSTLSTRAPGGTFLGAQIRDILLHKKTERFAKKTELFLFLADRAQHTQEILLPALDEGKIILCDRFNDSTLAYQGAEREGNLSFIETLCQYAVDELEPDLTLYLDLDPKLGLQRARRAISQDGKASYDRMENETLEFHQRVRECYLKLVKEHPKRIVLIDAGRPLDEVFGSVIEKIKKRLGLT